LDWAKAIPSEVSEESALNLLEPETQISQAHSELLKGAERPQHQKDQQQRHAPDDKMHVAAKISSITVPFFNVHGKVSDTVKTQLVRLLDHEDRCFQTIAVFAAPVHERKKGRAQLSQTNRASFRGTFFLFPRQLSGIIAVADSVSWGCEFKDANIPDERRGHLLRIVCNRA
jgi:hypothetical protein